MRVNPKSFQTLEFSVSPWSINFLSFQNLLLFCEHSLLLDDILSIISLIALTSILCLLIVCFNNVLCDIGGDGDPDIPSSLAYLLNFHIPAFFK